MASNKKRASVGISIMAVVCQDLERLINNTLTKVGEDVEEVLCRSARSSACRRRSYCGPITFVGAKLKTWSLACLN